MCGAGVNEWGRVGSWVVVSWGGAGQGCQALQQTGAGVARAGQGPWQGDAGRLRFGQPPRPAANNAATCACSARHTSHTQPPIPPLLATHWAGGFSGDGIKTVIPATARAKLAARLVPDQSPAEVLEQIERHIERHHPPACNVTIKELGFKGAAFVADRTSRPMAVAAKVRGAGPWVFGRGGAQAQAG